MEADTTQSKYPKSLEELATCIEATLLDQGVDISNAHRYAIAVIERVRSPAMWGGLKIYIPSGKSIDVDNMRREIARRWDGKNTQKLCREFYISESRLRRLAEEGRVDSVDKIRRGVTHRLGVRNTR